MKVSLIFVLITLVSALAVSFGSAVDRPEKVEIPLLHPHRQHTADDVDLKSSKQEKRGFMRQKRLFNVNRDARSTGKHGLNVILLLVNDLGQSDFNSRVELQNEKSFPVQGIIKSCQENAKSCDCAESVNTNIAHLLSWAAQSKEMSTSILYELPAASPEKESHDAVSENANLHVDEVLKKVKESFSQTMLRNLGKDADGSVQPSLLRRINFRELASRTLEDLSTSPNEKGFVMVATASADELGDALEILRRHASGDNNLVVVASMCPTSQQGNGVQFYARGPGSTRLLGVQEASQLPHVLRDILNDYHCRVSPDKCIKDKETLRTFVKRQAYDGAHLLYKRQSVDPPTDANLNDSTPDPGSQNIGGGGDAPFQPDESSPAPSSAVQAKIHQFSSVIFASAVLLVVTKIIKF